MPKEPRATSIHEVPVDEDELEAQLPGFEDEDEDALDLNEKEPLLPDGYYDAVVEKVEMAYGPKGDPYYNVRFKLLGEKGKGKAAFEIMSFSENARSMTKRSLKAILGVRGSEPFIFHFKSEMDRLIGHECTVRMGTKVNNRDETVNDVISVLPAGKADQQPTSTKLY